MINLTDKEQSPYAVNERNEQLAKLEVAVLALTLILALVGNGIVLLALKGRKLTRVRYCILHLAIADILVAVFNILPQMIWDITYRFRGNDFLCRLVKFLQVFVMYLSTYILVVTAVDRYLAICHPFSPPGASKRRIKGMVLAAWLLSFVFSAPQTVIFRYQRLETGQDVYDCWATFEPAWTMPMYITCFTFLVYIIPLVILVYMYGRIGLAVWGRCCGSDSKHAHPIPLTRVSHVFSADTSGGPSALSSRANLREQVYSTSAHIPDKDDGKSVPRKIVKTIRLTFVVVIAYVVCWSPFFVTQLWWSYDTSAPTDSGVFVIMLLLASLNSCCNPWIYLAFSGGLIKSSLSCLVRPASLVNKRHKRKRKASVYKIYFRATNKPPWEPKGVNRHQIQTARNLCPHVRHAVLRHSPTRQFAENAAIKDFPTGLHRSEGTGFRAIHGVGSMWKSGHVLPCGQKATLPKIVSQETDGCSDRTRQVVSDIVVHETSNNFSQMPDFNTV